MLGRFTQPDSIIPSPVNPQAFSRYSYVGNRPINFNDPSGHIYCGLGLQCGGGGTEGGSEVGGVGGKHIHNFKDYGVDLVGFDDIMDRVAAEAAVRDVANAIAESTGQNDPVAAFRSAYDITDDNHMLFRMQVSFNYDNITYTAGGVTIGPLWIEFANLADATYGAGGQTNRSSTEAWIEARNNIVHELGHAFGQQWLTPGANQEAGPYASITSDLKGRAGFQISPEYAPLTWNQHPSDTDSGEVFADMFLGWTYNEWNLSVDAGIAKQGLMNDNMPGWLLSHP